MIKMKVIISVAALISTAIVLSGCSKTSEPDIAKNVNANQSQTVSNSNTISANNNMMPVGNNVSAGATITPPPMVFNDGSTATANKNTKNSAPPVKAPTPQTGGGGDFFLFTQLRGALDSADKEFTNGVIIQIKEGNVTLTGNVSSQAQKTKAGQLIQGVQGVKSVKNDLSVSSK